MSNTSARPSVSPEFVFDAIGSTLWLIAGQVGLQPIEIVRRALYHRQSDDLRNLVRVRLFQSAPQEVKSVARRLDDEQALAGGFQIPLPAIKALNSWNHVNARGQALLHYLAREFFRLLLGGARAQNNNFVGHRKEFRNECANAMLPLFSRPNV